MPTLAQVVRKLRDDQGLSREKLAAKADTSTSTVIRIELRDHQPGVDTLMRIADALGVTISELLADVETTEAKAG